MRFVVVVMIALAIGSSRPASAQEQPRFPVPTYDQLTPEQKKWADDIAAPPRNAKFSNPPYGIYVRNPELAARITAMSDYLRWKTSLPARLSKFAILISARHWTSQYEWHQHYPLAIKGGLDPKILDDMIVGKRPSDMKDDETILYELVTQLYRDKAVSDDTFAAGVGKFGERGVLDIVGIVGFYDFVAMALITAKVDSPHDGVPRLQAFPK